MLNGLPNLKYAQQAEAVFNKIFGPSNKNYPGLISMLQGFKKYIECKKSEQIGHGRALLATTTNSA